MLRVWSAAASTLVISALLKRLERMPVSPADGCSMIRNIMEGRKDGYE
jgi:hypothetical protein